MCRHVKFGSSASNGVCINRREIKNGERLGTAPCGRGVADPLKYVIPHMCYPAEFGRSRSNGTSVIKQIHLKI